MTPALDQRITNLIADAQTYIDAAHADHLEHGVDTLLEGYRNAFLALTGSLHDLTRSTP